MGSQIASIAFEGDIIHVNFYADAVALILSIGLLVLCSKGIIRDSFEAKIFRWLIAAVFGLTISNGLGFIGADAFFPKFLSMFIQTVNELLINAVVILWLCYSNYRIYRSRDFIMRSFMKYIIPLFIIVAITFFNLFFGYLIYIDDEHVWHVTWGQALCETIRFCYVIACIIQVASYKKKHREFKFFTVAGFVIPMLAGTLYTGLSPYSVIPLGFAIGITNIYAGIVNEASFMDRETGYYNRFYLRFLEGDIREDVIPVKSAMVYHVRDTKRMASFSRCLDKVLPQKCVMIRYNPTTIVMLAGVSDRIAFNMMREDVEEILETMNKQSGKDNVNLRTELFFRKRHESALEFYQQLLKKLE